MSRRSARFLGIDFSGKHAMWSRGCRRSNVWIATVDGRALVDLRRVQDLPGDEPSPFARLSSLLRKGDYRACGIDAPFAVPVDFMPRTHSSLLARVASVPKEAGAPMTAACLTLLHEAQRPVWPYDATVEGTLCEAFPSAQVVQWNALGRIVEELAERIDLGRHRRTVEANDDARDAVLATFGAIAVARARLASLPDPRVARVEGWVAVHR